MAFIREAAPEGGPVGSALKCCLHDYLALAMARAILTLKP